MNHTTREEDAFRIERPALDLQVLGQIELLGDVTGVDLVGQLAVVFLADARLRVNELHEAIMTGDAEALARSAHNLIGSSATFGATGMVRLCAALESESESISAMVNLRLLEEIQAEIDRVRSALDSRVRVDI
jgi:HPt (histidine-containing phosphotransfer) domain-containing protein